MAVIVISGYGVVDYRVNEGLQGPGPAFVRPLLPKCEPARELEGVAGNSFGHTFVITTAGESHGAGHVVIIDGCPPGLPLSLETVQTELDRRRPGQSSLVTARAETDQAEFLSGLFEGRTTGTPIAILVRNRDQRSRDYAPIKDLYRPGHADFSYDQKYGRRDYRGGGRASARETVVRVAAGSVAKEILRHLGGVEVLSWVRQVGDVVASIPDPTAVRYEDVEFAPDGGPNPTRCPDPGAAKLMETRIKEAKEDQDSLGGIAEVAVHPMPVGLGEPVFDKLKADLAKAIFSLPAVVGVEFGAGFELARMRGSSANDVFVSSESGDIHTKSNRHGGILGGISTGMPLVLRAALKPPSSIARPQATVTRDGTPIELRTEGRHDPCVLPRFVPIAEAMVAIVLVDHWLRQLALRAAKPVQV